MLRRLRGDQGGYTLVEMLMAIFILTLLLGAVVLITSVVQRSEPELNQRAGQLQQARVLMERLGRELRQSYAVREVGPATLTFDTWVSRSSCGGSAPGTTAPAIRCAVTYSCTTSTCSRGEGAAGTTPVANVILAENLDNSTPFSATPVDDPEYIEVTLRLPASDGDDAITLTDGLNLRNEADLT
jgi:prepilin-type N-terminal cleavage/methylation domain-containing protein